MQIGVNAVKPAYGSTAHEFADLMKQASAGNFSPSTPAPTRGPDRWPTGLAAGQTFTIIPGARLTAGDYTIAAAGTGLFRGESTFSPPASASFQINFSGAASHVRSIRSAYSTTGGLVRLSQMDNPDPLHNVRVWRPGCDGSTAFNPAYVDHVQKFACVRLMEWAATHTTGSAFNWSTVVPAWTVEAGTAGARRLQWEMAVALANESGVDPWFCVPVDADDAFYEGLGAYLAAHLDAARVPRIEYGNEYWLFGKGSTNWIMDQAAAEGISGWRWAGRRAAQMWQRVRAGFGDRPFVRVAAGQAAWTSSIEWTLVGLADEGEAPDEVSCAPYFGEPLDLADYEHLGDAAALDAIFADLRADLEGPVAGWVADWVAVAAGAGVPLTAYECGQHLAAFVNPARASLVNVDPRMAELYTDSAAQMRDAGFSLACWFNLIGADSPYGTWGLKQHVAQPDAEATKWLAVLAEIPEEAEPTEDPVPIDLDLTRDEPLTGGSVSLDGATQYLTGVPVLVPTPGAPGVFAAGVTFRLDQLPASGDVAVFWEAGLAITQSRYRLFVRQENANLRLYLDDDEGNESVVETPVNSIAAGVTYAVVFGFDGTQARIYLDGVAGSNVGTPATLGTCTHGLLAVGALRFSEGASFDRFLDGRIADLWLAPGEAPNQALADWAHNGGARRSADEVAAHLGYERDGGTLRALWRLDESTDFYPGTAALRRGESGALTPVGAPPWAPPLSPSRRRCLHKERLLGFAAEDAAGWSAVAAADAPVFSSHPARCWSQGGALARPGAVVSGLASWTLGLDAAHHLGVGFAPAALWVEVAADGSYLELRIDAEGRPEVAVAGAGGAGEVAVTCPKSAYGSSSITGGSATNYDATYAIATLQLADASWFSQGDRVVISGAGAPYDGIQTIRSCDGAQVTIVVPGNGLANPTLGTVRAAGDVNYPTPGSAFSDIDNYDTDYLGREVRPLALRVVRDGDALSWYADGRLLGTADAAALPAGPTDAVTSTLGAPAGWGRASPTGLPLRAVSAAAALSGSAAAALDLRLACRLHGADGFAGEGAWADVEQIPGSPRWEAQFATVQFSWVDDATGQLAASWTNAQTQDRAALAVGDFSGFLPGHPADAAPRTWSLYATSFDPRWDAAGAPTARARRAHAKVGTVRRRPRLRTRYVDTAANGGAASNDGWTAESPKAWLSFAADTLPGDLIRIAAGFTRTGSVTLDGRDWAQGVAVCKHGAGANPKLTGSGGLAGGNALFLKRLTGFVLRDLDVDHNGDGTYSQHDIRLANHCAGLTLSHGVLGEAGASTGIGITGGYADCVLVDSMTVTGAALSLANVYFEYSLRRCALVNLAANRPVIDGSHLLRTHHYQTLEIRAFTTSPAIPHDTSNVAPAFTPRGQSRRLNVRGVFVGSQPVGVNAFSGSIAPYETTHARVTLARCRGRSVWGLNTGQFRVEQAHTTSAGVEHKNDPGSEPWGNGSPGTFEGCRMIGAGYTSAFGQRKAEGLAATGAGVQDSGAALACPTPEFLDAGTPGWAFFRLPPGLALGGVGHAVGRFELDGDPVGPLEPYLALPLPAGEYDLRVAADDASGSAQGTAVGFAVAGTPGGGSGPGSVPIFGGPPSPLRSPIVRGVVAGGILGV